MPLDGERERTEALAKLRSRLVAWGASRLPREDAEDLAHDVLALMVTKYATAATAELVPIALGVAWKMRAARWRKAGRRCEDAALEEDAAALADDGPDPEEQASAEELKARMLLAIRGLGGRCRELVRLKLEERTFPDIAQILGAKINTVYSWDHRCMARLRELMGGTWEARA